MENEMDLEKMNSVEEVLVTDTIKKELNSLLENVDNIQSIIIIYKDKENYLNSSVIGFETDWESLGMLDDCKNMILNGDDDTE
jgi:hypothetical protein